jgi:hypothetical protein
MRVRHADCADEPAQREREVLDETSCGYGLLYELQGWMSVTSTCCEYECEGEEKRADES